MSFRPPVAPRLLPGAGSRCCWPSAAVVAAADVLPGRSDRSRRRHVARRVEGRRRSKIRIGYDFVANTFADPGERHDLRAQNVNTIDEVPDSSWFVNRIGRGALSTAELVRGPDRIRVDFARRLEGERRQVDRTAAGLPDDRPVRPSLSDRVRSSFEPRDGHRRGDHRNGVLSRVRVSHRRGVRRRTGSGENRDRRRTRASPIR